MCSNPFLFGGQVETVRSNRPPSEGPSAANDDIERLHNMETVRQAAILNALPAHVALLDNSGIVIAVNRAWTGFKSGNSLAAPPGVGISYLQICDDARDSDAPDAHRAAAGIRLVLAGTEPNYSLAYACHSQAEQRWFQMTVTALADNQTGAMVMHTNVTAQRQADEALRGLEQTVRQSEQYFHFLDDLAEATRTLLDAEQVLFVMTRMLGEYLKASRCAYADVEPDSENFTILHDYTDGCPSTVGKYHLSLFGTRAVGLLTSGETLIVRDVKAELAPDDGTDMFDALGIQAIISCPLVKDGRLRAIMAVHQTTPRDWSESEIAIVQEVVERCWATIERRTAEEKLRASDALLGIAGRTAQLGGWAVNVVEQRVTWSDEVCNILEVPLGVVPGLEEALSFYVPASRPIVANALEACLQHGTPFDLELEMITAKGRPIWVRCAGEPLRNSGGTITEARGAFQNITERKRAASVLQTSMEEFRTLAESMPQIVWITRPDGWNIYFNQHWVDYTGQTLEESHGHGWHKPFHADDQQLARDAWQRAVATKGTYVVESRLRRADGEFRWWLMRGVPLMDAAGAVLKWFGTCTDIHDMKLAELAILDTNRDLRESERRFSNMLGNVQLVSVMLDTDARITYCNDYLLRLTGWQRDEVMGRDWFEVFLPSDSEQLKRAFAAAFADPPESWHRENAIHTRAGESRLIRWNTSMLRSGAGVVIGLASIGEDITEQKRAEIGIKQLNRVYTMLSQINALIVRVHDRDELFREACRIAVEAGGFRMSMIGIIDSTMRRVIPVAWMGKDEDLKSAVQRVLASDADAVNTMVARAVREKRAIVANDSVNDASAVLREQYTRGGVRSLVVLPLIVSDEAIGVLALYASEPEFFHEEELKLLTGLTNDIAFGIDHIDKGERLNYLAYFDSLTGLPNRVLFHERLTQRLKLADEQHRRVALVLMDVERFRTINETFGRKAADALLRELGARMIMSSGDVSRLARIDGDHFAIMIFDLQTDEEVAHRIDQRVEEIFGGPFHIGDTELRMAAKFGIAMFPNDGADADALFRNAEAALKNAKTTGDRYLVYAKSMNERVAEKLVLENQLRQALENEEFVLHYQPKVDLASGAVTSCEALIRWNDPRTGLVPPGKFIPVLEETGLIFEVGRWALRKSIADYLRWRAAGLTAIRIAVNVSPLQLRNRGFVAEVRQLIGVDEHAAAGLELEITEGMIMDDIKNSIATLQEIRAMGVTVAIDDFGTGFSSLSYLARLPVDTLKIDRSFVNDMTSGSVGLALVSTIIALAHSVKLKVVAEGVETPEQLRVLRWLKCDEMQGFHFSRPVPTDIFEAKFLVADGAR